MPRSYVSLGRDLFSVPNVVEVAESIRGSDEYVGVPGAVWPGMTWERSEYERGVTPQK